MADDDPVTLFKAMHIHSPRSHRNCHAVWRQFLQHDRGGAGEYKLSHRRRHGSHRSIGDEAHDSSSTDKKPGITHRSHVDIPTPDGAAAAKYVDTLMQNVNWEVSRRYIKTQKSHSTEA
jgi:hypothetical protein